jgi:hypothetical protein
MNKFYKISLIVVGLIGVGLISSAMAGAPKGDPSLIVPEPISMSLFLLGGAAVGLKSFADKRRKK